MICAAESLYEVGSPSKFDITTFPNVTLMRIDAKEEPKKKNVIPSQPLRPLANVPKQIAVPDNEVEDIQIRHTATTEVAPHNYSNPSKRDIILRYIATIIAIISALILVK